METDPSNHLRAVVQDESEHGQSTVDYVEYVGMRVDGTPLVLNLTEHERLSPDRSLDLVRHSPAGFDWGYTGSGPAQLACADLAEVPEEIESITRGLAGEQPPTNPLVVLKAARWWYIHGEGGTDPAFQWAIEWARHLATDTPSDVDRFDAFLEYLVAVGFADGKDALR